MTPRDTRTGSVLEKMIIPALEYGKYKIREQVVVGTRPNGRKHKVDLIAWKENEKPIIISLKWQQVSGTAEQKVPFEIICLADILLESDKFKNAYLVLGGNGWTLKEYYLSGNLEKHLTHSKLVKVVDLYDFIAIANNGEL